MPVATITGLADAIDPRNLLRLFSLYQMKDRAGTVGANGNMASLLRKMLAATDAGMRVCGHSFGAKVMLSALCAPAPLPRTIASLLLLQPAISHLAMAGEVPGQGVPGGYRRALDLVAGPIFTTFSELDQPLHDVFHLALRRSADIGEARDQRGGRATQPVCCAGVVMDPRHSGEHISSIPSPSQEPPTWTSGTSRLDRPRRFERPDHVAWRRYKTEVHGLEVFESLDRRRIDPASASAVAPVNADCLRESSLRASKPVGFVPAWVDFGLTGGGVSRCRRWFGE